MEENGIYITKELDEILVMLKTAENKLISEPNVTIRDIIDIYTIHLAVLYSYYDMSEALEFIQRMYGTSISCEVRNAK